MNNFYFLYLYIINNFLIFDPINSYDFYETYDMQYIGNNLRNNKNFELEIIKMDGRNIQYVSDELKNNIDIAMKAIKKDGRNIQYVSEELKNNIDIAMTSIEKDGRNI